MSTETLQPLQVDLRFWQLARQMSIQRLEDAFVEIVTNCNDAYDRMEQPPAERAIAVEVYGMNASKAIFIDQATGMSDAQIEANLLQVGTKSEEGSAVRGYFGRGAKDTTAVGNVTYECIKDGLYNKCLLTQSGMAGITVRNQPVTPELRAATKIVLNGTRVTIDVSAASRVEDAMQLYYNVINYAPLRDIMSNPQNVIVSRLYTADGVLIKEGRVGYQWPAVDEVVFNKEFEVPLYSGVTATFVLNRSNKPLPEPRYDNEMQYGILIRSAKSIHEVTTLRPQWRYHVAMPHLFGSIKCDYIMTLMDRIESEGPTADNPFAVLDPARKGGINVDHPFIQKLYSIPAALIESYLPIVTDLIDDSFLVEGAVQSLIENLQIFASDILQKDEGFMLWQADETGQFARALEDIGQHYVRSENDSFPLQSAAKPKEDAAQIDNPSEIEVVMQADPEEEEFSVRTILERGSLVSVTEAELQALRDADAEPLVAQVRNSQPQFQIKFSQAEDPPYQYNMYRTRNQIVLIININYPLMKKYFPLAEDGHVKLNSTNATFLADTMSEALTRLLLITEPTILNMRFQNMKPQDTVHQVFNVYERKHREIDSAIDDHVAAYVLEHGEFKQA